MNNLNNSEECAVQLYASSSDWFEGKALDELMHVSQLEGMRRVVAFLDMHSGMDTPNGAVFI